MDSPIICPNCGAPNESTSSSCQFCGAPLAMPTKTKTNRKKKTKSRDSSSNASTIRWGGAHTFEIKGKPQIKYDERIFRLEYDELKDEAELCLSWDIISLKSDLEHFYYSFALKYLQIPVNTIISDGMGYFASGELIINKFHIYKEDIGLLETFCNLNLQNCKVEGFYQGEEIIFVLVCRAFYHTIFDHSKYTDAADKLYEYYHNEKIEKERAEEETQRARNKAREEARKAEEEEERIDRKASRGVNGCIIIFVILFLVIPMVGTLAFPDTWLDRLGQWLVLDVLGWIIEKVKQLFN